MPPGGFLQAGGWGAGCRHAARSQPASLFSLCQATQQPSLLPFTVQQALGRLPSEPGQASAIAAK